MATGDPIVDTLIRDTSGLWNTLAGDIVGTPATVTYSFMTRIPDHSTVTTFAPFNEAMKEAARAIFAQYEAVTRLHFVEVDDAGDGGQIQLGRSNDPVNLGFAGYPSTLPTAGYLWLSARVDAFLNPAPGSLVYRTMMHEIGHTLGMFHPGNYNVMGDPPPPPYLPPELDHGGNTVMSYFSRPDGTWAAEPQPFDILALQYAYGMREPGTIGNLTYGSEDGETLLGTPETDYRHGQGGDDAIALDAGDDGARGNAGDDSLEGGAGNDTLFGDDGLDLALGGDGDDRIDGGAGDDDLNGNRGRDTVRGGAGADFVRGGQDNDTVFGDEGDDWHVNGNLGDDLVHGGAGNDTLHGGAGNDTLSGDDGDDRISGDVGDDVMIAGAGADLFVIGPGHGADTILGLAEAGAHIAIATGVNDSGIADFASLLARAGDVDGAGVVIDLGGGHSLALAGVAKAQLGADDFLFF
ncbi:hypothetical protein STVA_37630 [Allostella vacuolata]|nr:hypothetical protein STVA_37630 [Stella vacuolata]